MTEQDRLNEYTATVQRERFGATSLEGLRANAGAIQAWGESFKEGYHFGREPYQWHPIDLTVTKEPGTDVREYGQTKMDFPRSAPYSVASVDVLICYTVKRGGTVAKRYAVGYFDHDGDTWSVQFSNSQLDLVYEWVGWAYFDACALPHQQ